MERIYRLMAGAMLVLSVSLTGSCSKSGGITDEDIDEVAGTYKITGTEEVKWGYDSGTLDVNSKLKIEKVSGNTFKTSGYFSTTGHISGSYLYFDSFTVADSGGSYTVSISSAMYLSGRMSFTVTAYGTLSYNGRPYMYHSKAKVTARKSL